MSLKLTLSVFLPLLFSSELAYADASTAEKIQTLGYIIAVVVALVGVFTLMEWIQRKKGK